MAFEQILVPIDYSEPSDAALRVAGRLARAFDSRLLAVHVLPLVIDSVYSIFDYAALTHEDALANERERLTTHVRAVLEEDGEVPALEADVACDVIVLHILDVAVERRADLIVIGTHGRTGIKHVLLGSVAEKIVRLAPCPVLTVREHTAARASVVRAVDSAAFEPDGHIGNVGGLMRRQVVTIDADAHLEEARVLMANEGVRHLPVLQRGELVGILSDRDLPLYAGQLPRTRVHVAMTPDPTTITADVSASTAARLMRDRKVRALPVVEGAKVIGIVSVSDVLEDYVRAARR